MTHKYFTASDIKARLSLHQIADLVGHQLPERAGCKFRCTLRPDHKASCDLWATPGGELLYCDRSQDLRLDSIGYYAAALDIDCGEAMRRLGEHLHLDPRSHVATPRRDIPRRAPAPPYLLTDADLTRMRRACECLQTNEGLRQRLLEARPEWTEAGLLEAAAGDLGMERNGNMLFGYKHGIKARWKPKPGEKRPFVWLGGPAGECWRQSLLMDCHRTVYLAEGETDAITLLSCGLEAFGKSLVLAISGTSNLPAPEPFTGRNMVLCLDADQSGREAVPKLLERLGPLAASIRVVDLASAL